MNVGKLSLFLVVFFSFTLKAQSLDLSFQDFVHKTYVYQVQSMEHVNWLYIGFAPRMQDPERIRVVFSKASYTMRVSMLLTRKDVADYPGQIVKRAYQTAELVRKLDLQVYQWWRLKKFLAQAEKIRLFHDTSTKYSEQKFRKGLKLLKKQYPTNIFDIPNTKVGKNEVVVVAQFVYPITINKEGKGWPQDGTFTQYAQGFTRVENAVNERRTDHGQRVNGKRVILDHIFSGFPAFWIDSSGVGTGVHGPIISTKYNEKSRRRQSCANYPKNMKDFWAQNEFREEDLQKDLQQGLPSIQLRWDLIRTNNSLGCFRSEPMELRHLLPSNSTVIWKKVKWVVTSNLDKIIMPQTRQKKYVDVNYYILNQYDCPYTRREWVNDRIITQNRGPNDPRSAEEFIANSYQFEYLDPATIEYHHSDGFNFDNSYKSMESLNQAGSHANLEAEIERLLDFFDGKASKLRAAGFKDI